MVRLRSKSSDVTRQSSICPFDCSQGQASYFSQKVFMYEELLVYSCAQVRIWPFHSRSYRRDSSASWRMSLAFASDVTVRTSWLTPDGYYPLPFPTSRKASRGECSDFPLPATTSKMLAGSDCPTSSDAIIVPMLLGFVKKGNPSIIDR